MFQKKIKLKKWLYSKFEWFSKLWNLNNFQIFNKFW
jgi:hypothetical protein